MPQSLSKIYLHIIFSTKNRQPFIGETIQPELYAYIGKVLKEATDSISIKIGGMPDHVHILCIQSKKFPLSKLVEEAKKRSSKWIKTKGEKYKDFQWQNGYGAFSVSQSHVDMVIHYIEQQKEHHKKLSFQDEFCEFLEKYQVKYDERYVWD